MLSGIFGLIKILSLSHQLPMPEQTLWDQLPTDDTSVTVGIFVLGLAMYWLWETVNSAMEEKMKGKKAALQAARAKTA